MAFEVRIPTLGESVTEGVIVRWAKQDGEAVKPDDILLELETDKASMELPAERAGVLRIVKAAGEKVAVGELVARIEEDGGARAAAPAAPRQAPAAPEAPKPVPPVPAAPAARIAERLVQAQQTAAILTTFNELDMSAVIALRAEHKERFQKQHGIGLGFMSFFARACIAALRDIPVVNAEIRGDDIIYRKFVHLGVAVGTERGLVVPVLHHAERMSFAHIEREIARLAGLARDGKLKLDALAGGTFTISNGGVYGSLLSTPILNPPQSAILGMHKIEKRPVVVDEQIVVRPMMYVAVSYDHRLVAGEQAVAFLVRGKERRDGPERLLVDV